MRKKMARFFRYYQFRTFLENAIMLSLKGL
jgi:hypothetical protein